MQVPLIRLQCGVNSYDWGKIGKDSAAAIFAAATPSENFSIQADRPYAEVCSYTELLALYKFLTISSCGWERTLPIPPKMSLPNALCSILSKTTKLSSLETSAQDSAISYHFSSKFSQSARRSAFRHTRIKNWPSNCTHGTPRIIPMTITNPR